MPSVLLLGLIGMATAAPAPRALSHTSEHTSDTAANGRDSPALDCNRRRLIDIFDVDSLFEKAESLCSTVKLRVTMTSRELKEHRVEKTIKNTKGVFDMHVAYEEGIVTIQGSATAEELIASLKAAGFDASEVDSAEGDECVERRQRRRALSFETSRRRSLLNTRQYDAHVTAYEDHQEMLEQNWFEVVSDRLTCWWERTPLREQLGSCRAALSHVVVDKMSPAASLSASGDIELEAESGCEWVRWAAPVAVMSRDPHQQPSHVCAFPIACVRLPDRIRAPSRPLPASLICSLSLSSALHSPLPPAPAGLSALTSSCRRFPRSRAWPAHPSRSPRDCSRGASKSGSNLASSPRHHPTNRWQSMPTPIGALLPLVPPPVWRAS